MNDMPKFDRRSFLVGAAAAGGGLTLGNRVDAAGTLVGLTATLRLPLA